MAFLGWSVFVSPLVFASTDPSVLVSPSVFPSALLFELPSFAASEELAELAPAFWGGASKRLVYSEE